jgi:hypothetical protein
MQPRGHAFPWLCRETPVTQVSANARHRDPMTIFYGPDQQEGRGNRLVGGSTGLMEHPPLFLFPLDPYRLSDKSRESMSAEKTIKLWITNTHQAHVQYYSLYKMPAVVKNE